MERCANCEATIGKLETPHIWNDEVVCSACHHRLSRNQSLATTSPPSFPVTRVPPEPIIPHSPPHVVYVQEQHQPVAPSVQTIERTGKTWKGLSCLGALTLLGGVVIAIAGGGSGGQSAFIAIGVLMGIIGFGIAVVARIGAWWYHG